MACLLPNAQLTAAEKACCKEMANHCDQAGMPKSHSCCQPAGISVADSSLIKTIAPEAAQPNVVVLHDLPSVDQAVPALARFLLTRPSTEIHGPPGLELVTTSVLRI